MSFGSFWATVELLTALDASSKASSPFEEADVDDWLEDVSEKVKMQLKRASLGAALVHRRQQEDPAAAADDDDEDDALQDNGNLLDCSFAYSPVRSRLEQLMGSSVVRLTERKYMLKLMSRIRQEHEAQQQARIQERKRRELMRTKKLILSRLIPVDEAPTEIREYPLFQLYLYCDAIIEKRRKKRASRRVRIPRSLFKLLYPAERPGESSEPYDSEDGGEEEEAEEAELPMKEILVDGVPTLVPMSKEEIEQAAKDRELAEEVRAGYMLSKEEYESLHYEADAVKKLRESRSVDEMYAKAQEIVGLLYSVAGAGADKRKRCTINEQTSDEQDSQA